MAAHDSNPTGLGERTISLGVELMRSPFSNPRLVRQRLGSNVPMWCALSLVLATVNNFHYCLIFAAAATLADKFKMGDQMPMFGLVLQITCTIISLVNGGWFVKIPLPIRVVMLLTAMVCGYTLMIVATLVESNLLGFLITVAGAGCLGFMQSVGELGLVAFFRNFPPSILGSWGAGTGIAGILAPLVWVFLTAHMSYAAVFTLLCLVTIPIYALAFWALWRSVPTPELEELAEPHVVESSGSSEQKGLSIASMKAVLRTPCALIIFHMVIVYVLEYLIIQGMMRAESLCPYARGWVQRDGVVYSDLYLFYNVGVLMSRASIALFQVKEVKYMWIFTGLQFLNVILWTVEGVTHSFISGAGLSGYYVLFAAIAFVGLMGGSVYANCVNLFNTTPGIPDNIREAGINLGFFMSNIGMAAGMAMCQVLTNTAFSMSSMYPDGCAIPIVEGS